MKVVKMDSESRNEKYYGHLRKTIILIILLVSVIPLVLITLTIRHFLQASYSEKVQDHLTVLIKKHRQNIDTFLNEKLAEITVIAQSNTFEQLSDEKFLKRQLQICQNAYGEAFVDLGVVNERGIQVSYAGPYSLTEADYSKAQWFTESLKKTHFISDVFPGLRGIPHFIIAVTQEKNGEKWILRATIDFDAFNSLVESIRIGSTGFAFILNSKGEFQTKPRSEVNPAGEPYKDFLAALPEAKDDIIAREVLLPDGRDVLYFVTSLKNGQWLLSFQQDAADAYAALYRARTITIIIFLAGITAILAVSIILSRRVVRLVMRADQENKMMNERIIEAGKLASLGELAAGIAHEINNPVAVMVEEAGWMQDLLQEDDLKKSANLEEFTQSLSQIRTQGVRCKQITHKLLSFARKTDPRPQALRMNDLVTEVVNLCQQRAVYATTKISTDLEPNLPIIYASPTEMQQVLMNLINNSLDAIDSSKGGNVTIATRIRDGFVVIDVADDGPGIPEAYLQRIFDPFFTTKPPGKGTGLGLSICYGIVSKMGGEISVNSAPELGTAFHILLPFTETDGKTSDDVEAK
jgi:two-component system, NtrC family, sensor kinase